MATFQPPPTYAEVVLYDKNATDPEQLIRSAKFNPIWLKWFIDVAAGLGVFGTGSVSSVGLSLPAEFSVGGSPVTTTGTLAATWAAETHNFVFAGPTPSGSGTPTFRALVAADLPGGTGTVTSVAQTVPAEFIITGSPVTTTGTLAITKATQTANQLWAGPTTGAAAVPTFRALVPADLGLGWTSYTPTRTGWTDVGSPTVTARYTTDLNKVFFQIKVIPFTTVATVAGTSYVTLPVTAAGLAGDGSMGDLATFLAVGDCVIDVANSRCYVPTKTATGDSLLIAGWYEK